MNKDDRRIAKMVSKDFDATLRTIVRSLSEEEIALISEYKMSEKKEDFDISLDEQSRGSIFRRKSMGKYELVVDSLVNTLIKKPSAESTYSEERVYTRTIVPLDKGFQKKKENRSLKFFQKIFPSFNYTKIPFEGTSVYHLSFHIIIKIDHKQKLRLKVTSFYTVNMVKEKICKRLSGRIEELILFYKDKRLDGSNLLYSYDIKSSDEINLEICKPITIYGILDQRRIPLVVYSSTSIMKIKDAIMKEMNNVQYTEVELKYKDNIMEDCNELYIYNVWNDDEISIVLTKSNDGSFSKTVENEVVNDFFKITDNLSKCNCVKLRYDVMAKLLLCQMNGAQKEIEIIRYTKLLQEFNVNENFHHMNCFKIRRVLSSSISCDSTISEITSTSYSGSHSSLKSMLSAENNRISRHYSLKIENEYVKEIAECEDFKVFKHLLANKIGTKCNLRSVTLLYKYARATVRFIGFNDETTNNEVEKIIQFTKLYFARYFKKEIVKKGGLDALTLSGSDVE